MFNTCSLIGLLTWYNSNNHVNTGKFFTFVFLNHHVSQPRTDEVHTRELFEVAASRSLLCHFHQPAAQWYFAQLGSFALGSCTTKWLLQAPCWDVQLTHRLTLVDVFWYSSVDSNVRLLFWLIEYQLIHEYLHYINWFWAKLERDGTFWVVASTVEAWQPKQVLPGCDNARYHQVSSWVEFVA